MSARPPPADRFLRIARAQVGHAPWVALLSLVMTLALLPLVRRLELRSDWTELLPRSAPSVRDLRAGQRRVGGLVHPHGDAGVPRHRRPPPLRRRPRRRAWRRLPDVPPRAPRAVERRRLPALRARPPAPLRAARRSSPARATSCAGASSTTAPAPTPGTSTSTTRRSPPTRWWPAPARRCARVDVRGGAASRAGTSCTATGGTWRSSSGWTCRAATPSSSAPPSSRGCAPRSAALPPAGFAPDLTVSLRGRPARRPRRARRHRARAGDRHAAHRGPLRGWPSSGSSDGRARWCCWAASLLRARGWRPSRWRSLTVGHLNTSTAFLGQHRDRQRDQPWHRVAGPLLRGAPRRAPGGHRRHRRDPRGRLGGHASPPRLAASLAYGSLAITDFRGFRDFGIIPRDTLALWLQIFIAIC
jgi:hypothetical protein